MKRTTNSALLFLVAFGFAVGTPVSSFATQTPFVAQMEYWVRDGGEWTCDNPFF